MSRERELLEQAYDVLTYSTTCGCREGSVIRCARCVWLANCRAFLTTAPVTPETPMAYRCGDCGAEGVKLWREYQTFLEHQYLRCRACAEVQQGKTLDLAESDTIGWLVPAVPTDDGTFWGYTSVPEPGVAWWKSLPERAALPKEE